MEEIRAKLSAKSALAVAISYVLKRWLALTRYLDDGHLEIDNLIAARYFYSDSGYLMLAGIIEKVSGRSFRDFLKGRVFDRLGLTNTQVDQDDAMLIQIGLPDMFFGTVSLGSF